MKERKKSKNRVQLDLSDEAVGVLDSLKKNTGATTRAEVVRNAISLFKWVVEEQKSGHKICSIAKDGKTIEPIFPFFLPRRQMKLPRQ